jgi:hypothetical protein
MTKRHSGTKAVLLEGQTHQAIALLAPSTHLARSKRRGETENHPALNGAWEEIRTPDLRITNALLYRLSYPGASSNST